MKGSRKGGQGKKGNERLVTQHAPWKAGKSTGYSNEAGAKNRGGRGGNRGGVAEN